jgi:uncharacterized protein (TIGR00106 family)
MKAMAEICVIPLGDVEHNSPYMKEIEIILEKRGIEHVLHDMGTNMVGELELLMSVTAEIQLLMHKMGLEKVTTIVRISTNTKKEPKLGVKVKSVLDKLKEK